MNRDKIFFLAFLGVFIIINIYLLASNSLPTNWNGLGIIIAAGITLSLYSFLYKDNPLFKFTENLYVGVAAAYTMNQVWYTVLLADVLNPTFNLNDQTGGTNEWLLIFPVLLGLFMLTQLASDKINWLSRIALASVPDWPFHAPSPPIFWLKCNPPCNPLPPI
jgi:hypothetical protein